MNAFVGEDDELNFNTATRVPVCLCVDLSGSMLVITDFSNAVKTERQEMIDGKLCDIWEGGTCRLDELNVGLASFFKIIQNYEVASDAVELAIVGFRDQPVELQNFQSIYDAEPFLIGYDQIGDMTNMDAGVNMALNLLEQRKSQYKNAGRDYFQPWLIIMSDGEVDANSLSSQIRTKALEDQDKLVVSCFIVGNQSENAEQVLSGYSNRVKPRKIENGSLEVLFRWIGQSVVKVSNSKPEDKETYSFDDLDKIFNGTI